MDLSKLSTDDLVALRSGELGRVSTAGLQELKRQTGADPQAQRSARAAAAAEPIDNTMGMSGVDLARAGLGKSMVDLARSVHQGASWLGNKIGAVSDADHARLQADLDERARIDRRLMDNGSAVAGNVAGQIGAALIPGTGQLALARKADALWKAGGALNVAKSLGTAGALGAAQNVAMNPRTGDDGVLGQAAGGGALGAGGQLLAPALAAVVQGGRQLLAGSQGQAGRAIGTAANAGRPPDVAALRALAEAIQRNATEIVPGSLPTAVQAAGNDGISQLARTVGNRVQGGALAGRAADQNAARLASLGSVGEIGADSISARTAAGDVLADRMGPARSVSSGNVTRLYGGVDPFGQSRMPLPIKYVDEAVGTYFGPGAGPMPAELRGLVDDVRSLGMTSQPPIVPQHIAEIVRHGAPRPSASKAIDFDRDSLSVAVRKMGGLDLGEKDLPGELRGMLADGGRTPSVVHGPLARRASGRSADEMADLMYQRGYIDEPSGALLLEKLAEDVRGSAVWSMNMSDDALAAARGAFADMPEHMLRPSEAPSLVDWRTLQNLRSRASEAATKLGMSGDRRAAAVAQQIRDQLDATAEEVAGRAAMRQVLERGTDAPSAMFRRELGEIDFPWGEVGGVKPGDVRPTGGLGVSHLVAGRSAQGFDGQQVAMTMPEVLARGRLGAPYGPAGAQRRNVSLGPDAEAVLSQGPGNHWLLTGWNDSAPGVRPVVHSVTDYTPGPSVIQNQGGAGAGPIVGVPGEFFAPDMAHALRAARSAKIEHEARFGTGPSKLLFKDGPDGTPRLQGAQRFDAFFNAGAKQREAIAQLQRMTQGDAEVAQAFRGGAITDLVQSATNKADELSLPKYERWVEQRSEALKGLLDGEQLGKVKAVLMDLKRADKAANAGRATGSNTAQNLAGDGLLGGLLLDRLAAKVPYAGPWVAGSMRDAQRNRTAGLLDAILADPSRTAGALNTYAGLLDSSLLQRGLAYTPNVMNPLAGGLLGAMQSQPRN